MDTFLILAQEDVVDAVDKGVGILKTINDGGVPLICLVIAVVCGVGFYWQLKRNNAMSKDHLDEVKANKKDALTTQEGFLREIIEQGQGHQEANLAQTQAMEGFSHSMRDAKSAMEQLQRQISEMSTTIIAKLDAQNERIRTLEDEVRRRSGN